MNWFSRIFSKKSSDPAGNEKIPGQTDYVVASNNTQPVKVLKQNLTIEQLKKFVPLRDFDDPSLATTPHISMQYNKGAIIFSLNQACQSVLYLLAGRLIMYPDGDNCYEVTADSTLSSLPLNGSRRFGATAKADTDVVILEISVQLDRLWRHKKNEYNSLVELAEIQLPDKISKTRFFNSFACAYRENKLRLPSLPDIAFKLQEAVQKDIGIKQAVDIIQLDPPIVAKLIQVANSPLYSTGVPANNCLDAVSRIGLDATRNLVMGISLKQLFNCTDPDLMKGMHAVWKNSLYVSSLSFVLAQDCSGVNPEDALLAGLISDIAAIPLLHFAEQFPDEYPSSKDLLASLPYLRAPVGALVLHTLGFSEQLTRIPYNAENWLYDSGPELTLDDIVILAKLHSYFGSGKARDLPYINSIPAYGKIKDGKLNPDFSLKILHKAQHRINAAIRMLS